MKDDILKSAVELATAFVQNNTIEADKFPELITNLVKTLHNAKALERRFTEQFGGDSEGIDLDVGTEPDAAGVFTPAILPSASSGTAFNAAEWLESLPERTIWAETEARKRNHYVERGWVGVSDSHILCLLDGKPVRLLTTHLKRNYKNMPHVATPEAYRAHFMLPPDYPMGSPQFQAVKSSSIHKANQDRLAGEATRPAEIQGKIDAALKKSNMDLSAQANPETRPGLFEHDIVCLHCSAKVQDLAAHLRSDHKMSLLKYISVFKISSRYPGAIEPVGIAGARARADELLSVNKIDPKKMVNPKSWPGVAGNFIVCLEDGAQIVNLEQHLETKHRMSMDTYRTKYGLPKDFPSIAVDAAGLALEAPAPKKVGRPAKVEAQTIKTRKSATEVQVVRKKAAPKTAVAANAKGAGRKGKLGLNLG